MSALLPLLLTALAAAALEFLTPGGASSKMSGAVRAVAGLCVLAALVSPLKDGLSLLHDLAGDPEELSHRLNTLLPDTSLSLPDEQELTDAWAASLASQGEAAIQAWVKEALSSQFGIPADRCLVKATVRVTLPLPSDPTGAPTATIADVRITLSGSSVFTDPHTVEAWLSQRLDCPCTVVN